MKLRTKFILLSIGIALIPLIVGTAITIVQFLSIVDSESLQDLAKTKRWIHKQLPDIIAGKDLSALENIIPEVVDVIVLDEQNRVLFSTLPSFKQDKMIPEGEVFEYISENSGQYEFRILHRHYNDSETRYFVIQIPEIRWLTSMPRPFFAIALFLSVLIFLSIMLASITRSIRKSIQTLESATSRIAQGDLDFELKAKGNDMIASLTRSFNSMRMQVKEEYARRARFLMGVSHDLKTPLALIEGYADAIRDGYADEPEKLEKYISIIKDKSYLLEERITHLIELIKLETGDWQATHSEVKLKNFLRSLGSRYSEDAWILGYDFRYKVDIPDTVSISMDPDLVTRVLENLINNAIRYSEKKGIIKLEAGIELGTVYIAISNRGSVISEQDINHIFDPFFRGSNSRREPGFGLGLATVRSIIRSHGWDIGVESGEETVFTIRISIDRGIDQ
jgi:signal transduction histidine kinase